ncbi:MAG: site-specific integrase [Acidimicrobiales bacterium]
MRKISKVNVSGPLVPFVVGFHEDLKRQGYTPLGAECQLRLMAHVSRWMAGRKLSPSDVTTERVDQFLRARRRAGYTLWLSPKGVAPLLAHLRGLGVVPPPDPIPATPLDDLLGGYRGYLLEERGLATASAVSYVHVARLFLAGRSDASGVHLSGLEVSDVLGFVTEQCRLRNPASITCGLRSFLRYCFLSDLTSRSLAEAVPSVANWRLAPLPKALEPDHVRKLLTSCDRRTAVGQRDFAMLTVLVRLGLRAGEVVALELGDIDWRTGEVVIRGKGPRIDRLPLPADVGEAITAWLHQGRKACSCPNVFTRIRAPRQALSSSGVSAVVAGACQRAGLPVVHAHRLRHTAATEMLRAGSNLDEVGQVLRHQKLLTTSIYAKVDRTTLSALALPWPGGVA